MALTQARAACSFTGCRYGSFAGRAGAGHPVDTPLTQPLGLGGYTGRRYGPFAEKAGSAHPVGALTQLRAHGAFSGRRYGSFVGRTAAVAVAPSFGGGGVRVRIPSGLRGERIDEDDMLLVLAALWAKRLR